MNMNGVIRFTGLAFFVLVSSNVFSQNAQVSGFVRDAFSKEVVIGAKIYIQELQKGVVTNNSGFYSLELPIREEKYTIQISAIGFKTTQVELVLEENKRLDVELAIAVTSEVEIVYTDPNQTNTPEIGVLSMPVSQLKNIPNLGGEPDIIKAFQMMPGVSGGKEGSSGLFVRGGTPDQNLFLLDDVPLYYVNHIGGFISTFDPNAINSIKLYKGGFPAQYAGRLSSVIDIRMKDGNLSKHTGEFSIGLLTTKLNFEGPIGKDSTMSYFLSMRRFNLDLFMRPITRRDSRGESVAGYTFYDINGKIVKRFKDGGKLSFSIYEGRDNIFFSGSQKSNSPTDVAYKYTSRVKWGNFMSTLNYTKPLGNKVFWSSSLSTTNFNFGNTVEGRYSELGSNDLTKSTGIAFQSGINDLIGKSQFEIQVKDFYTIQTGVSATYHRFTPGRISYSNFQNDTVIGANRIHAFETNAFIENRLKIGKHIFINAGLNFNSFFLNDTTFLALQPRVMTTVYLNDKFNIQFGYSRMTQNLHYLANSGVGLPSDLWLPATKDLIPEIADQYNFGFTYSLPNKKFPLNFVLEGFYKDMRNLIEFQDGVSLFSPSGIQEKIVKDGTGTVYGIELLIQKNVGKLTGWVGYTWSKNTRQFDDLNNGNPFPFIFDRRHDFSLVLSYKLNEKIQFNATWMFMTGNAITLGSADYSSVFLTFQEFDFPFNENTYSFVNTQIIEGKNGYRMPSFHKLDVGVNFIKRKERGLRTWFVGVYNVYNQANPFFLFYKKNNNNQVTLHQLTLFPIIPSFSYSFVFDTEKFVRRKKVE